MIVAACDELDQNRSMTDDDELLPRSLSLAKNTTFNHNEELMIAACHELAENVADDDEDKPLLRWPSLTQKMTSDENGELMVAATVFSMHQSNTLAI